MPMPTSMVDLVREEVLDSELAALLWLLVDAPIPVVVGGAASRDERGRVIAALLGLPQAGGMGVASAWPDPIEVGTGEAWPASASARLLALHPGDRFTVSIGVGSLRELISLVTAEPGGLTEDEVRALGLVLVVGIDARIDSAHLLRPVERDAQGHLQRRPPAVLAARDPTNGQLDHFAWGIAPELADRIDLSERDLDRRWRGRARLLSKLANGAPEADGSRRLTEYVAAEPAREPAPPRPRAREPWSPGDRDHVH